MVIKNIIFVLAACCMLNISAAHCGIQPAHKEKILISSAKRPLFRASRTFPVQPWHVRLLQALHLDDCWQALERTIYGR